MNIENSHIIYYFIAAILALLLIALIVYLFLSKPSECPNKFTECNGICYDDNIINCNNNIPLCKKNNKAPCGTQCCENGCDQNNPNNCYTNNLQCPNGFTMCSGICYDNNIINCKNDVPLCKNNNKSPCGTQCCENGCDPNNPNNCATVCSKDQILCMGKCYDKNIFNCSPDGKTLTCLDGKTTLCHNNDYTIANCCLTCDPKNTEYCLNCDSDGFQKCPISDGKGNIFYNCCLSSETTCMCKTADSTCNNSTCCPNNQIIPASISVKDDACDGTNNCCCPYTTYPDAKSGKTFCCKEGYDALNSQCNTCGTGYCKVDDVCYDETIFNCTSTGATCKDGSTRCGTQCCKGRCNSKNPNECSQCNSADSTVCKVNNVTNGPVECCYSDQTCACIGSTTISPDSNCINDNFNQHCCKTSRIIQYDKSTTNVNECCPYSVYPNDDSSKQALCTTDAGKINCCQSCFDGKYCDQQCGTGQISCMGKCYDKNIFSCSPDGKTLTCLDGKTTLCHNNDYTIANCCLTCDPKNTEYCLNCDSEGFQKCPIIDSQGNVFYNCCLSSETTCMCKTADSTCNNSTCCPKNQIILANISVKDDACDGTNNCCCPYTTYPNSTSGKTFCCKNGYDALNNQCNTCGTGYCKVNDVCYDETIFNCTSTGATCKDGSTRCGTQCCNGSCNSENPNECSQCNSADSTVCKVNNVTNGPVECCYSDQTCACIGSTSASTDNNCIASNLQQHCCKTTRIISHDNSITSLTECCPYSVYPNDDSSKQALCTTDAGKINCCQSCYDGKNCDQQCGTDQIYCMGKCWDGLTFKCITDGTGNQSLSCIDPNSKACVNKDNTVANCCLTCDTNNTGHCLTCDSPKFQKCPITDGSGNNFYNCCLSSETTCMCKTADPTCNNSTCCPNNQIILANISVKDDACDGTNNCCCPYTTYPDATSGKTFCCKNGYDALNNQCNTCSEGYFKCAGKCWNATQFTAPCTSTGNDPGPACATPGNKRCGNTCCPAPGTCNTNPNLGCAVPGCTDPSRICDAGLRNACCAPNETCACVGGNCVEGNICCNVANYIPAGTTSNYEFDICCPVPVFTNDSSGKVTTIPVYPDSSGKPLCCPTGYNATDKMCGITCGNFATNPTINTSGKDYDPQVCLDTQGCALTPITSITDVPQHSPPYCTAEDISMSKCNSGTCFSATCNWGSTTLYPNPKSWNNSKTCESTPMYINECNNETSQSKQDCNKSIYMVNRPVYSECDVNCQTEIMPKDSVFSDYVRYSYVQGSSECKELDCLKKMQEFGFENYFFDNTTFECVAMAKPSGNCNNPDKQCAPESCQLLNKLPNTKTMKESDCPPGSKNNCVIFENLQETNCIDKSSNCITDPFIIPTFQTL